MKSITRCDNFTWIRRPENFDHVWTSGQHGLRKQHLHFMHTWSLWSEINALRILTGIYNHDGHLSSRPLHNTADLSVTGLLVQGDEYGLLVVDFDRSSIHHFVFTSAGVSDVNDERAASDRNTVKSSVDVDLVEGVRIEVALVCVLINL